ncbi:MAG: hypothetical protein ABI586_02210 [Candidatus Nanopelagicales bacterium]
MKLRRRFALRSVASSLAVPLALSLAVACTSSQDTSPGTSATNVPLATPGPPIMDEAFKDDSNGWGIVDSEDGHNYYAKGQYVVDFRAGPFLHWVSDVLAQEWEAETVDLSDVVIKAKGTTTRGEGVVGVFCRETVDTDAEFEWYEFVVRDGYAAIRRADLRGNLRVLAETDNLALPLDVPFTLEATCVNDNDDAASLSLGLDGEELLRATDGEDALTDGLVGIQIWDAPDSLEVDPPRVEWDSFLVSEASSSS